MKIIPSGNMSEPDITVVGTKGQIVIPLSLRRKLGLKPKTRLVLYGRGDKIVLTKLRIPPMKEKLDTLFKEIDEQYKGKMKPTDLEILKEIQAYRRERQAAYTF